MDAVVPDYLLQESSSTHDKTSTYYSDPFAVGLRLR